MLAVANALIAKFVIADPSQDAEAKQDAAKDKTEKSPAAELAASDRRIALQKLVKRVIADPEKAPVVWDQVFSEDSPSTQLFSDAIESLHERKHFNVAVEGMLSAIRNGHAAPWMYDVLALEMKLAGRSPQEIARVLDSRIDFATSDVPQMLITIALLSRFEAFDEAVAMCREAAELDPESRDVWLLARSVADRAKQREAQVWARCGILTHVWNNGFALQHAEATKVLADLAAQCDRDGQSAEGQQILKLASDARAVDMQINLHWVGAADLDMFITEPGGEKCSYKNPVTKTLGRLVREEGVGSGAGARHTESYVCHTGLSGDYEIAVRFVLGKAVAGTAVVEIIQHAGTNRETRATKTITLAKDDVTVSTTLTEGRLVAK